MKKEEFSKELIEKLNKINVNIENVQIEKFYKYMNLLVEWNEKINLTAITEPKEIILKHFVDCITILKYVPSDAKIVDVGTGAGFPGIPLNIMNINPNYTLVDSLNKRINFLNIVIKELELENITAIHTRIEEYAKENKEKFDIVTARAVAPLNILLELGINLVKINKYFIAMKGNIENEPEFRNAIKTLNCSLGNIIKFKLPIEESNRSLIKIIKEKTNSKLFPRKYNEIKKKPL